MYICCLVWSINSCEIAYYHSRNQVGTLEAKKLVIVLGGNYWFLMKRHEEETRHVVYTGVGLKYRLQPGVYNAGMSGGVEEHTSQVRHKAIQAW
jgi:hypothetical protein